MHCCISSCKMSFILDTLYLFGSQIWPKITPEKKIVLYGDIGVCVRIHWGIWNRYWLLQRLVFWPWFSRTWLILCSFKSGSCTNLDAWKSGNRDVLPKCSRISSRKGRLRVSLRIKWIFGLREVLLPIILKQAINNPKHCKYFQTPANTI